METLDFIRLVRRMLAAQQQYFRERTVTNLTNAKVLESKVRHALAGTIYVMVPGGMRITLLEDGHEAHL